MIWFVIPGIKTTTPLVSTKSSPAVAVPPATSYETVTGNGEGPLSRTWKLALVIPESPSITEESSMTTLLVEITSVSVRKELFSGAASGPARAIVQTFVRGPFIPTETTIETVTVSPAPSGG